jgi:hypothetical protein
MMESARVSATALAAIATCCLIVAGCAGVKHQKTAERVPTAVTAEAIIVAEPPETTAPQTVPEAATVPQQTVAPHAAVLPPKSREPLVPPIVTPPVRPPAIAAAPVPPPAVPKAVPAPATAPAPVASQPARAPLDLESLGARLKQTRAIGVLTKLSLKNQVDDLLERFRAYHSKQGAATLPELRRSYDMLMLKVLSLLQDTDPPLARDIVQSRAAIWGILADPRKFNEASLMAGATT